jgi:predicted CoA-binding protein
MATLKELAADFLAQRRIAVAGVSRDPRQTANFIFRKLRDSGHEVIPVNPRATTAEGVPCYPDLRAVSQPVDALLIVTPPGEALGLVRQCAELGVPRVWMHQAFGAGSVSPEALRLARERGLVVIARGCPMMFCEPVDVAHRCFRWLLALGGSRAVL